MFFFLSCCVGFYDILMIKALKCVSRIKLTRETIVKFSNWWAREHLNARTAMQRIELMNTRHIGRRIGGGGGCCNGFCSAQTMQCDNVRWHHWRMNNNFVKVAFRRMRLCFSIFSFYLRNRFSYNIFSQLKMMMAKSYAKCGPTVDCITRFRLFFSFSKNSMTL